MISIRWSSGVALGVVMLISACSGVGDGNRPDSLRLVDAQTAGDSVSLFQCFEGRISALVRFTDGTQADFLAPAGSRPVILTSSDESVVRVSNGDLPVPLVEGVRYPRGTLIPVGVGTATVRGAFSDLSDEITVVVDRPDAISVTPAMQTVAVGTAQLFAATAVLDGTPSSVTSSALWTIEDAAGAPVEAEIATIGAANGLLAGIAEGGPFTVRAQLSGCPDAASLPPTVGPQDLTATVAIKPARSITIEREFERAPGEDRPLLVGTSEAFAVTAVFDDEADGTQDISNIVTFQVVDSTAAEGEAVTEAVFGLLGLRNVVVGLGATSAPLAVSARLGAADDATALVTEALPLTVVSGTLAALDVQPKDVILQRFQQQDYAVEGRFTVEGEADRTIDVRRHVLWTSSVPGIASINTSAALPGRATALVNTPGCTLIRAQAGPTILPATGVVADQTRLFVVDDTVDCAPITTTP